jgi:endonuclease YncB( thermonuclease family)
MARRRRSRRRTAPVLGRSFLRRRSTPWLIGALALFALAALIGSLAGGGGDETEPAAAPTSVPGATASATAPAPTATPLVAAPDLRPDPARLEEAELLGIIDGDTIDVRIGGREERVRYYGVDTTERGEDCFGEATDRNEALAGDTVLLLPDARERDRYDRLLRYAFTADGRSIEALLIAEGLGYAWREDGAYRDALVALEGQAEQAGVGCLWE